MKLVIFWGNNFNFWIVENQAHILYSVGKSIIINLKWQISNRITDEKNYDWGHGAGD